MSIYSDINMTQKAQQPLVVDVASIKQSLISLFSTNNDRLFNPEISGGLGELLFELIDTGNNLLVFSVALQAINRWEPRVILDIPHCQITPDYDNNRYILTLSFQIKGMTDDTFSLDLGLSK